MRVTRREFGKAAAAAVATVSSMTVAQQSAATEGGEASRVHIAFIPNANHLPLLVADEEGFFKKEGLDVTLAPVQNLGALAGAIGKQYDLGSSTIPDVIMQQQQGLKLVLAANIALEASSNRTVGVLVAGNSPIRTVADMKGVTLAAGTLGGNLHPSVLHWLRKGGVELSSVTVTEVPFPNMADQLMAGRVQAVESLEPFRSQLLKAGARELVDPLTELADPISFVSLMSTAEFVAKNPTTMVKFKRALDQAIAFIKNNEAEARGILAKGTKLPTQVVMSVPLPAYSTKLPRREVALWAQILADLGRLRGSAGDVRPDQVIPVE